MSKTWLVGIAGGSGSGKTWLAKKVEGRFPQKVCSLSIDWYYRDLSSLPLDEASKTNFDHPDSIEDTLLETHVKCLLEGQSVMVPGYTFSKYSRIENAQRIYPKPITILEGIFALHFPNIRKLLDDSIFIETPSEIRLERRIARDQSERGYSYDQIVDFWKTRAQPMYKRFVQPSSKWAKRIWKASEDNTSVEAFLADLENRLASNAATDNPK